MKTELDAAAALHNLRLHGKICERAEREFPDLLAFDRMSLMMDLESVPELDCDKLLNAPKLDFAHDILGIQRHMDRSSYPGHLTDCFWPRCAIQQ